jgi:Na+/H+-dicarboxylate symporter
MITPSTARVTRSRFPLAAKIVIGMFLGVVAGLVLGERAEPLSRLGSIIIDMIKGLAGPLLLFAVIDACLRTKIHARSGAVMVAISLTNAAIAIVIGLSLSNLLQPGRTLRIAEATTVTKAAADLSRAGKSVDPTRTIHVVDDLVAMIPTSLFKPVVENSVISIVIIALLVGLALRRVKQVQVAQGDQGYRAIEHVVESLYRTIEVLLGWAVQLVPLAVFGVVARTIGRYGFGPFGGLMVYLGVGILGLSIQVALPRFWRGAGGAITYAMGTASSLATLPVTLKSLRAMGVSDRSARLAACVGTNLNNDGILLYEAMAVLFVAQACGISLTLGEQIVAAGACAIAGIGISGIPEAGLISLILVVRTVLPNEPKTEAIIPILLTVDWVLGRCRAMTNVTSDIVVAVLLDRLAPGDADDSASEGLETSAECGLEFAPALPAE